MWMVGYNEGGEFNTVGFDHSFSGRKLRPLMPSPMTSPNNNASTTTTTTPSLNHIHGNDFVSQYHYHHHLVGEHSKQCNAPPVVVSSRWNPTPEQLRALEELYRRGTRTPSAEQIQHITAQLRRFGKIEGKNVFYWFQNHKARERQKRRRQMEFDHTPEKKDLLAASKTVFEVQETKNLAPSTNCSTLAEESVSIQRTERAVVAGCRTDGWLQFDDGELQQRRNFLERNATWQMMQLKPCPPPAPAAIHLINTPPNTSAAASCSMATTTTPSTTTTVSTRIMDPKLIKTHDLCFFPVQPQRENGVVHLFSNSSTEDGNCVESQTLQLFPVGKSGDGSSSDHNINHKETEISASAVNADLTTPSHGFFEFLPLKN